MKLYYFVSLDFTFHGKFCFDYLGTGTNFRIHVSTNSKYWGVYFSGSQKSQQLTTEEVDLLTGTIFPQYHTHCFVSDLDAATVTVCMHSYTDSVTYSSYILSIRTTRK